MDQLGFAADAAYVESVMQIFGNYDTNGDGALEFGEFGALWEQLGSPSVEEPGVD